MNRVEFLVSLAGSVLGLKAMAEARWPCREPEPEPVLGVNVAEWRVLDMEGKDVSHHFRLGKPYALQHPKPTFMVPLECVMNADGSYSGFRHAPIVVGRSIVRASIVGFIPGNESVAEIPMYHIFIGDTLVHGVLVE